MIVDAASEVLKIPESDIEPAPGMMLEGGLELRHWPRQVQGAGSSFCSM